MQSEPLVKPTEEDSVVRGAWHIQVLAKLAAWYNQGGPHKPPQPGILDSIRSGNIVIGSTAYTVTKGQHPVTRELCLLLTEHTGHNAVPGPKRTWRFKVSALERVYVEIEGEEVK